MTRPIAVARTPQGNWIATFLPVRITDVPGYGATKYAAIVDLLMQADQ